MKIGLVMIQGARLRVGGLALKPKSGYEFGQL